MRAMNRPISMLSVRSVMQSFGWRRYDWFIPKDSGVVSGLAFGAWWNGIRNYSWSDGMSSSPVKIKPFARDVKVTPKGLHVSLADGREIVAPLAWFPRLRKATKAQRGKWRLIGRGIGIHWED